MKKRKVMETKETRTSKSQLPPTRATTWAVPLRETASGISIVHAFLLAGLIYLIHRFLLPPLPSPDVISGFFNIDAIRFKLFESGFIPYCIQWTFFFGLMYLAQILKSKIRPIDIERSAEREVISAAHEGDTVSLDEIIRKNTASGRLGYYTERFSRLLERWKKDQDLTAVISLKNEILEIDEENFSLSFVAVRWSEWTLPLLGFLGTVIGISRAISGIKDGVQQIFATNTITASVLEYFGQGFRGLAIAFDTTFLGLAGLIVIGGIHLFMKKRLAVRLAEVRELFTNVVSHWLSADPYWKTVEAIARIEARIQRAESMIEQVIDEDPNLNHVKNVLFKHVVEFAEVQSIFVNRTRQMLDKKLGKGKWSFNCISVSSSQIASVVAGIRARGQQSNYLFFTDIGGNGQLVPIEFRPARIQITDDARLLVAVSDPDSELIVQPVSIDNASIILGNHQRYDMVVAADDSLLQMAAPRGDLILILHQTGVSREVKCLSSSNVTLPTAVCTLDPSMRWPLASTHGDSMTLVVAGKSQDSPLWRIGLIKLPRNLDKSNTSTTATSMDIRPQMLHLPPGLQPQQVEILSESELIIVDSSGSLHYWALKRPAPFKIRHRTWIQHKDCVIRLGKNGWIAAVAAGTLGMWHMGRGGGLSLYQGEPNSFQIPAIDVQNLRATSDGRHIVAATNNNLIAWEFPLYYLHDL